MFKKTLLALAVTGVVGSASAATIGQAKVEYSLEGIANETSFNLETQTAITRTGGLLPAAAGGNEVGLLQADVGIDTGYAVGDKIQFTFTGQVFNIASSANLTAFGTVDPGVTFGTPVYTGNTVSFEITAKTGNLTATNNAELILEDIILEKDALIAGTAVTVTYQVISSVNGSAYEAVTKTIAESKAQISYATTNLDGVIDVADGRHSFTGNVLTDMLTITPSVTASLLPAVPTKVDYTVWGDFSFMDTDSDGTADYTAVAGGGTALSAQAFAADFQSYTFTDTTAAPAAVTLLITATNDVTLIPVTSFTYTANVAYAPATGSATSKAFTGSAGSWTLNGSTDDIAFLPFGTDYAQSITVTNIGSVDGDITVDLTAGGVTYTKTLTATATPLSVTNISSEVAAFAAESGITGDARINVVVNSPAANIAVKGLYYHKPTQDRVLTH